MIRLALTNGPAKPLLKIVYRSIALVLFAGTLLSCGSKKGVILFNPMNDTKGITHKSRVSFDHYESSDGSGSVRVDSENSWVLELFETGDLDIHGTTLLYEADFKTENLNGTVYLELRCTFADGKVERHEWGLSDPMTGSREWHTQHVEMKLRFGENPTNIKLNVYVDALGTLWIDNVKLSNK